MAGITKAYVYEILESQILERPIGRYIAGTLILLILLNVIAAVLETDTAMFQTYGRLFDIFAILSVFVFTAEYIVRVWCCTENPLYSDPVRGRLKYMATPVALIDLLVIAPFLLLPILPLTHGTFQVIRFLRIFWILKISHYSRSLRTFGRVFSAKRGEIFMAFFIMLVLLILGSALIFFAEHDAQPDKFSSVLASMWWGIETMATIGYGDMVPVTPLGKFIAGIVALLGVGLFALPAGIFASGFIEELHRKENEESLQKVCPHCGRLLTETHESGKP
jgi:voltage-gated potassium channel